MTHRRRSVAGRVARWSWAAAGAAAGVALTLVAIVSGVGWLRPPLSPPLRLTRFALPLSDGVRFTNLGRHVLSLAPDGSSVVFVADQRLYLRQLDRSEATEIPGTQSRTGVMEPAFSPDGRSIAYFSNDEKRIRRIAVDGGASQPVCDAEAPFGLSWTRDDLVFGQGGKGIMRVAASGGEPTLIVPVTSPQEAGSPQLLGDGTWLQFTITEAAGTARWERGSVVVQSLATGERRTLVREASDALVVDDETLDESTVVPLVVPAEQTRSPDSLTCMVRNGADSSTVVDDPDSSALLTQCVVVRPIPGDGSPPRLCDGSL